LATWFVALEVVAAVLRNTLGAVFASGAAVAWFVGMLVVACAPAVEVLRAVAWM